MFKKKIILISLLIIIISPLLMCGDSLAQPTASYCDNSRYAFCDDFEGDSIDTTKWKNNTISGNPDWQQNDGVIGERTKAVSVPRLANFKYEIKVKLGGYPADPVFRYQNRNNYYLFQIVPASTAYPYGRIRPHVKINGQWTIYSLPSSAQAPIYNDVWYTFKVVAKGNKFKFYIDKEFIGSWTDENNQFPSGNIGFREQCYQHGVRYDEIKIKGKVMPDNIEIDKSQITTDGHQENRPAISKDNIIYEDWENISTTSVDVRLYNLKTESDGPLIVKKDIQGNPDIWGKIAVWSDYNGSDYDIYGMNIKNGKEFPIAVIPGSNQRGCAIYKNIVVWSDNRGGDYEIYGYDIKKKEEFRITNDSRHNNVPRIWQDKVVWYTSLGSGYYIVEGFDLKKWEKFTISSKDNGYQVAPDIYRDQVVWADFENGGHIYFKDLETGAEKVLTIEADNRDVPRIYGDYVTWVEGDGIGAHNIYVHDLKQGITTQVSDDGPQQPSPTIPDIWQDTIVWMSWHSGNGDIYAATIQ